MFDHKHYVPDVRWKAAEMESLGWLSAKEKAAITPMIEFVPPNFRTKDGKDLPVRDAVRRIVGEIDTHWGSRPAFVDLRYVESAGISSNGDSHILEVLAEEHRRFHPLFTAESSLIPVTGLGRANDHQQAVSSIVEEDRVGACIRVGLDDVKASGFASRLEALLSRLRLDPPDSDLVLDLQCVTSNTPNLEDLCASIPELSRWRSFTLLSGSFPPDLQDLERDSVQTLTRDEWFYWREQVLLLSKRTRIPTFADYTIQHPVYREPKENCNPSASIRYTFEDYWVVLRGHGLKNKDGAGSAQYPAEAKLLCKMDEFCRPQFSAGDQYIFEASRSTNGNNGTPLTWLRAGVNHHMVFAQRQIWAFVQESARRLRRSY